MKRTEWLIGERSSEVGKVYSLSISIPNIMLRGVNASELVYQTFLARISEEKDEKAKILFTLALLVFYFVDNLKLEIKQEKVEEAERFIKRIFNELGIQIEQMVNVHYDNSYEFTIRVIDMLEDGNDKN